MRLAAAAALSIAGHWVLAALLDELPARETAPRPRAAAVRIVEAPPPPPPEPPPPPPPEPAPPPPPERPPPPPPRPAPARVSPSPSPAPPSEEPPSEEPPTDTSAPTTPSPAPVFGVSMSSTSQAGRGPELPVGNSARPGATGSAAAPPAPASASAPAAAHEVTKLPMPQGRCSGAYTEAARAAAIEGVVVLDLVVDETGRARDVTVVSGLGHGLTEAAVAALRACRFEPGERSGAAVAVRVRGFKIRFVLDDAR